jgi:uncharacterized cupin superfamily protein
MIPVSNVGAVQYEPFSHEGRPFGQVHWLRTQPAGDGVLFTGLWKHEPATFRYVFPGDETFHLLEGRVRIEVDGMPPVELRPGDIVSFPKGSSSTWTIHEEMKKFFVISG